MGIQRKWSDKSVLKFIKEHGTLVENDPINIIRDLARSIVLEGFTKGWQGPPFDMIKLAQLKGISVSPNSNVLDGRVIPLKNKKLGIEYNPNQNQSRINFSIAHEIGHTLFPDCREKIRNRNTKEEILIENNWELEFLCNVAASEFLLPYAEFSQEANSAPFNLETIKRLANRYKASIESVFLRYTEVINKPCTVAIASYEMDGKLKVEYSKPSEQSDLTFETGFEIPESSIAYKCVRPGTDGFTHPNQFESYFGKEYSIFAIGIGSLKHSSGLRVGIFFIPRGMADLPDNLIRTVSGDATLPQGEGNKLIVQVVNSSAAVGSGFGKAISDRYPDAKKRLRNWKKDGKDFTLGKTQTFRVTSDIWICQILAQKGLHPTKTEIPLKYWALRECLMDLEGEANDLNATVHMPPIGAGQAGGDWKVIEGMIHSELASKGIDVTVYFLHGMNPSKKTETETLTLFNQF